MLKKETIEKIEALLKIKDLAAAIADTEEKDIAIPDLTTLTDDELKVLGSNKYNEGKKAGVEMNVDEVKKKLGLEFTGKTVEGLVEAAQKKAVVDAKVSPDEKVKELTEKVTNLQTTVKDYETKLAEKDSEVSNIRTISEIHKHIPDFGENAPALSKDETWSLMKANGYDAKVENGNLVLYKDGKQVKDKLENAVKAQEVIGGFLKEKKLVTETATPSGRGGSDSRPPAVFTKLSEVKKKFETEGKSTLGEEFSAAVAKAKADNKEFDMAS
jgi:hypothetical protein